MGIFINKMMIYYQLFLNCLLLRYKFENFYFVITFPQIFCSHYNCLIQWAYYCKLAGTPKNLPNDFRESHRQLGESIINILADFMGQKMARKAVKNFIDVSLINKS